MRELLVIVCDQFLEAVTNEYQMHVASYVTNRIEPGTGILLRGRPQFHFGEFE